MKRASILIALLASLSMQAFAQRPQVIDNSLQLNHVQIKTQYGNAVVYFPIRNGMTAHQLTFITGPAVTAIAVDVALSAAGTTFTACGSQSTTLGDTITCAGTYSVGRITITGFTGSGAIELDYYGASGAEAGAAAVTAASGAFAAGSIAAGACVDGCDLTEGTIGDAAATQGSTGTLSAKLRTVTAQLNTLNVAIAAAAVTDPCAGTSPSIKRYISVGSAEDESQVKATAGTLCSIRARNANATTDAFLKCTNLTAANTTPGSSAVYYDMIVPKGGGYVDGIIHAPFSVALTCYIVTGKADSDATEVAADDVSYFLLYQ